MSTDCSDSYKLMRRIQFSFQIEIRLGALGADKLFEMARNVFASKIISRQKGFSK